MKGCDYMANIKPVNLKAGAITKEEKRNRLDREQKLRGESDKISPPDYLNEQQKNVFNFVVEELTASNILGNLDVYVLSNFAIAVCRLEQIEQMVNQDADNLLNKNLMSSRSKYAKDFLDNLRELGGLSPASRAKLGTINIKAAEQASDPLLEILGMAPKKR
jgi:P27 family predicted phage terminase small subunit